MKEAVLFVYNFNIVSAYLPQVSLHHGLCAGVFGVALA